MKYLVVRTLAVMLVFTGLPLWGHPEVGASDPGTTIEAQGTVAPSGALAVTLTEAVLLALENNRALIVQRMQPQIQETFENEARAEFDPILSAEGVLQRDVGQRQTGTGELANLTRDDYQGIIVLQNFFPTGTRVALQASSTLNDSNQFNRASAASRIAFGVDQALLRGFGTTVNLAELRKARLQTDISLYELRGFSQALIAEVERAYWDLALAVRQVEIVQESLEVARQQLSETETMITVGTLPESELPAVQAQVAVQQQSLIDVKSLAGAARLRLLRLLNPPGDNLWEREIVLLRPPVVPDIRLATPAEYVATALRMRPELNQAELEIRQGELTVVQTRNGLLPRLDLFVNLGKSGYADSFGSSVEDLSGESYDSQLGARLELPVFNRAAKARHQRALTLVAQSERALANLRQLVEWDVRRALLEVNRSREQITASTATRIFREENLRIETEKFRVGRSTNFQVAQVQRDLTASRLEEVRAVVAYLHALTDLYRLEGTLLERWGVNIPDA
jgi:outer membrane protein